MLYGNQSISYYSRSNMAIWLIMAFQAGVLNIGGLMAGHHFVSHVTGYATFFGYHINRTESYLAAKMLIVPIFFLLGAMFSGFFVDIRLKQNKRPKYYITFGIMFFLTSLVFVLGEMGFWGSFGQETENDYLLITIICFICGIQNGTISIVSKSVVRTTHLTGITTDLGLGIVRFFKRGELPGGLADEGKSNLMRIGIIIFFISGSVLGGLIFNWFHFFGFLLPTLISGCLFFLMLYFQIKKT